MPRFPAAVSSISAVIAGAVLPGDWGFFTSYALGGVTLVVLAIGSTSPGLLQYAIDSFSQVRERIACSACKRVI